MQMLKRLVHGIALLRLWRLKHIAPAARKIAERGHVGVFELQLLSSHELAFFHLYWHHIIQPEPSTIKSSWRHSSSVGYANPNMVVNYRCKSSSWSRA